MARHVVTGIVSIAALIGVGGVQAAQAAVYETGFEQPTFAAGESINGKQGWTSTASNVTALAQTATKLTDDQALGATVSSNAAASTINLDVAGQAAAPVTGDSVVISMALRIDAITGTQDSRELLLTIGSDLGETIATIIFERDDVGSPVSRDIVIRNGFSYTTVGQWVAGEWMNLQITLDTEADRFNVSIDGEPQLASPGLFQSNRTASSITSLAFGHLPYTGATYFVDDLAITVPEPASAGLVLAGAVLMTRRRS